MIILYVSGVGCRAFWPRHYVDRPENYEMRANESYWLVPNSIEQRTETPK